MRDITPEVLLLSVGSLTFLSGLSARVWRGSEARYRVLAVIVGLIFITMGALGLLGVMEIRD